MRVFSPDRSDSPLRMNRYERKEISSEEILESWLHANPEVLIDEPIFIFGRQYSLDTGVPDLLAVDQYGNIIVFELKVGKSGTGSASEETILGQPQAYARSLQSYTYPQLNEIYQTYRSYIEEGRWKLSENAVPAQDLRDAHERVFGTTLKPTEFNPDQRMVVVAEEITDQTKRNARYLLENGLNIQCTEVQLFAAEDTDESVLATSQPVDYDLRRVQPDRQGQPIYPVHIKRIVDRSFPEIHSLVQAEVAEAVFDDFEQRNPRLTSQHPAHPDGAKYAIRIRPFTDGDVMVSIDFFNDELLAFVRDHSEFFTQQGFTANESRTTFRIVYDKWSVESVEEVEDEGLIEEVADRYVELVEAGHEFFTRRRLPLPEE